MIPKELIEYVKNELAKGSPKEKITTDLIRGGGWTKADIDEAFMNSESQDIPKNINPNQQSQGFETGATESAEFSFKHLFSSIKSPIINKKRVLFGWLAILLSSIVVSLTVLFTGSDLGVNLPQMSFWLSVVLIFIVTLLATFIFHLSTKITKANPSWNKALFLYGVTYLVAFLFVFISLVLSLKFLIPLGSIAALVLFFLLFTRIYAISWGRAIGTYILNIVLNGIIALVPVLLYIAFLKIFFMKFLM